MPRDEAADYDTRDGLAGRRLHAACACLRSARQDLDSRTAAFCGPCAARRSARDSRLEKSIFGFVFRHSRREQILLLLLTVSGFPFLYLSLELPKTIINQGINGRGFPKEVWGLTLDQIPYLLLLCFAFLGLVLINGAFKYVINVWKGRLGERMLRRLRYELYSRVLRFPLPHFKRVGQGEIIPMITAETEPLGGFVGEAIAQPVFQGGQLLTILTFIMMQDPVLGLAAVSLYPFQGWLVPRLQRRVNALAKERVRTMRRASERIAESISGIVELRANDASNHERARFTELMGRIYDIRFEIYRRKFFIKFLNNFLAQLTPFFFYSIGGYLVIRGDLSFGALVAVLAAYKDMSAPWRELLTWYQQKEDARVKYEQVVEQFEPAGMLDARLQLEEPPKIEPLPCDGQVVAVNLGYAEDGGRMLVENASFRFRLDEHVAIVGPGGGGKDELTMLVARLLLPTQGRITIAGRDLAELPEAVTGRRIAYVGTGAFLFAGTIRDNLLLGLQHRPQRPAPADMPDAGARRAALEQASRAGNSTDDLAADWADYAAAGVAGPEEMTARLVAVLERVDLSTDVLDLGLRGTIDPQRQPELAERLLAARRALRERLSAAGLEALVEPFDPGRFNRNATLAENLLFGTPRGPVFDADNLAQNAYLLAILDRADLTATLIDVGRQVAELMVELFGDIDPNQEIFEQYSFISAEDLPKFQALLGRYGRGGTEALTPEDRTMLLSLAFRLIPARHRLGLLEGPIQDRIVAARHLFAQELPEALTPAIEFFDAERYNAAASIQDNILFGKIAHDQAQARMRVREVGAGVVEDLGIRRDIMAAGLDYEVGIGGGRLSAAQRQKLAIARALLKRPDLLIVNGAMSALDGGARLHILEAVLQEMRGRGVLWALDDPSYASRFDRVIVMRGGHVVEQGSYAELESNGHAFRELVAAE